MKQKILYVSCAILIILMFINIWNDSNNGKTKILSVPEKIKPQEETVQQQNAGASYRQDNPYASNNIPAITFIKKPSSDKRLTVPAVEEDDKIEKGQELKEPSASSIFSEDDLDEFSSDSVSGVTKINKRPTEEEAKEMSARGIILY